MLRPASSTGIDGKSRSISPVVSQNPSCHEPLGVRIRAWLEAPAQQTQRIGLPWVSAWAFLRVATNGRLFRDAISPEEALAVLGDWMDRPNVVMVEPGPRHADLLRQLVLQYQVRGPLVTDAVLAALALEQGATLISTDQGFRRFDRISWVNPLDEK